MRRAYIVAERSIASACEALARFERRPRHNPSRQSISVSTEPKVTGSNPVGRAEKRPANRAFYLCSWTERTDFVSVFCLPGGIAGPSVVPRCWRLPLGRQDPFYWTPLIRGLTYLVAAIVDGPRGWYWATALGLTEWGLAAFPPKHSTPHMSRPQRPCSSSCSRRGASAPTHASSSARCPTTPSSAPEHRNPPQPTRHSGDATTVLAAQVNGIGPSRCLHRSGAAAGHRHGWGVSRWGRAGRSGGRRAAPSWVPYQRSRVRRVSGCGRSHACAHTTRVRNARRRDALGVDGVLNVAGGAYQMVRGTALAGAGLSADGPLTVPRSSRWAGTRRPQTRTARRARGGAGARRPAGRGLRVP